MNASDMPLTGLTVQGYKSIAEEQRIGIRPLTILAGANSSGKSSMMQPLLLLKQTLEATFDPGALLLNGQNVHITSANQFLTKVTGATEREGFTITLEKDLEYPVKLALTFRKQAGIGVDIANMTATGANETLRLVPGMTHDDISRILPERYSVYRAQIAKLGNEVDPREPHWCVQRERCFLRLGLVSGTAQPQVDQLIHGVDFQEALEGLIHLPGLRGNPERTYPRTSVGKRFPGTFEAYTASIVSQWNTEKSPRLDQLGQALETLGLSWKVQARLLNDTQVELRVGRLLHGRRGGARDMVNISDVGFGVSQTLPVLVALLVAEPAQVVYLEQPEIHLHPRAQRQLAQVLLEAVKRNVIVIVETHSHLLLREVQTLVAKGDLCKEDLALHWFTRDQKTGATRVSTASVDGNGAYGDWPEDFDDVALESESDYLDAVERRGLGA